MLVRVYCVNLRIQSENGKMRTRENSVFGHFSHSGSYKKFNVWENVIPSNLFRNNSGQRILILTSFGKLLLDILKNLIRFSLNFSSVHGTSIQFVLQFHDLLEVDNYIFCNEDFSWLDAFTAPENSRCNQLFPYSLKHFCIALKKLSISFFTIYVCRSFIAC